MTYPPCPRCRSTSVALITDTYLGNAKVRLECLYCRCYVEEGCTAAEVPETKESVLEKWKGRCCQ